MRELTVQEMGEVSGGDLGEAIDLSMVVAGLGIIGLGIALAGTAGLAGVPIGIFGAATIGEITVAGTSLSLAGGGGVVTGLGLTEGDS